MTQGIALIDALDTANPSTEYPTMTNERVSNFAAELAQMAMASQRLPEVEQQLIESRQEYNTAWDTIQRLELKLIDHKSTIYDLHAKINDLEVANTAMELRFLECDDAKTSLARTLQGLVEEAQGALKAIAPVPEPKPEPTLEAELSGRSEWPPVMPRDTFQGVKSEPKAAEWNEDGWGEPSPKEVGENVSLYPFAPSSSPDVTPSTDASSSEGTEAGESASPLPVSSMDGNNPPTVSDTTVDTEASAVGQVSGEGTEGSVSGDPTKLLMSDNGIATDGEKDAQSIGVYESVIQSKDAGLSEGVSVPSDPTSAPTQASPLSESGKADTSATYAESTLTDYHDYDNGFSRASHNS